MLITRGCQMRYHAESLAEQAFSRRRIAQRPEQEVDRGATVDTMARYG